MAKINGSLGYYGLGDWWLFCFTEQERNYIESVYQPMGESPNAKPLTKGKFLGSTGSAAQLLWGLSTWFTKREDFHIAEVILLKAEELSSTYVDLHFTYQHMIQAQYKMRDSNQNSLEMAISYCRKQISIASNVAKDMKREFPNSELPSHVGYKQLAIILEKEKQYDEVIELCRQARTQGWNGDWEKRILRSEKKSLKQ